MKTRKTARKKIDKWFVAAEIVENTLFMMSIPMLFFLQRLYKHGLGNNLYYYFTYFKGDFSQMWFPRSEFDAQADFLANKMLTKLNWALKTTEQVEVWSDKFMVQSREFYRLPITKMSNQELLAEFNKVIKWHDLSHSIGATVSWHSDADKARVSTAISQMISRQIDKYDYPESAAEVFSVLSTPTRNSYAVQEEKEFLQIARLIHQQSKVRRALIRHTAKELDARIAQHDVKLLAKMRAHYNKWRWLKYAYKGPAYQWSFYINRWKALVASHESPSQLLRQMEQKTKHLAVRHKKLVAQLHLSAKQKKQIELAQAIVYLKEIRKSALYHGMYHYEPFFREFGKRHGLTLQQVWALNVWEIQGALVGKKLPNKKELNARNTEAVAYCDRKKYVVWTGQPARDWMKKIPKEDIVPEGEVNELTGMCASPGSARGVVKIIDVPGDLPKMRQGNILVSETTYPSLVPAMKKAAAIITNAGGLTTHAAIVSRELGVPCLVGTKVANKVLKDGDRVEVDATKGIVRRI
ncbi:MAG: PEP-utilizing enzyme [bacterium]